MSWRILLDILFGQSIDREVREFAQRFPGRCMICSYHQFGRAYGFVPLDGSAKPHHCIEVNS
jgi:hypothetical protein